MDNELSDEAKFVIRLALIIFLLAFLVVGGCNSFNTVRTGHVGVKTKFGAIVKSGIPEGLHFYAPFVGNSISEVDLRIQSVEGVQPTFTKDNQEITVTFSATYSIDPTQTEFIFRNGNDKYFNIVAPQILTGVMKEVVGQFDAETIVSQRAKLNDDIQKAIAEKLKTKSIIVDNFEITNFAFDKQYQKAIEDKMIATQRAKEAENKTAQVREEKDQKILEAQGDAESMRIKANALAQNKGLVEYEAVKAWDGKLPTTMIGSGAMPFINLPK